MGYQQGWDRRATRTRPRWPTAYVKSKGPEFRLGFEHGWHDGEGRGQSWEEHQSNPLPPQPRSPRRYEA